MSEPTTHRYVCETCAFETETTRFAESVPCGECKNGTLVNQFDDEEKDD